MKQLPVGIQDFKSIRNKGYYFVDKSMLIGQILDQFPEDGVFLYTRPRRFGKSLNLSMLDAFFNIKYEGNTWFDGLEISRHSEYDSYKNAFPVVAFSLKAEFSDFDGFIIQIKQKIYEVFGQFVYILDSPKLTDRDRDLFNRLYYGLGSKEELMNSFANLCALLEKYHGTKVVVLIDEYDASINNIKDDELRGKILSFIGGMLSPLLKEGTFRQLGIVTGIMQITKENIFSGLNNVIENDIFDTEFDEMFGFTNDEVKQICADYGHPEKFEEAKEWYDGYRFGDADIYNPWSILNYINKNFKPGLYWVNSGKITAVTDIISNANRDITEDLKALGSGESVQCDIVRKLIFKNLKNPKSIYSLLTVSGYLKAIPHGDNYLLSIPNRELFAIFSQSFTEILFEDDDKASIALKEFANALLSDNVDSMKESLKGIFMGGISSRALISENSYQTFIVAMLMCLFGNYDIKADYENGRGFSDILMTKKKGMGPNVVIELKRSSDDRHLEHDAKAALQQIKDKEYAYGLKGETILYGIAFSDKEPFIISEKI